MKRGKFLTRFFGTVTLVYLAIAYVPVKEFIGSYLQITETGLIVDHSNKVERVLLSDRLTPGLWKGYLNKINQVSADVVGENYLEVKKILTPFHQDFLRKKFERKYSDWKELVSNQELTEASEIIYQKKLIKLMPRYESFKSKFRKFKENQNKIYESS